MDSYNYMSITMYLREAAISLYNNKQRSILALIGIVIGIGSVIAMVSIGQIIQHEARKEFSTLGTNVISTEVDSYDVPLLRNSKIYQQMDKKLSCIEIVASYAYSGFSIPNKSDADISLIGTQANFFKLIKLKLEAGRFISNFDHQQPFVVLGSEIAKLLELSNNPKSIIGQYLTISDTQVQVIGILKPYRALQSFWLEPNNTIFSPIDFVLEQGQDLSVNNAIIRSKHDPDGCAKSIHSFMLRRIPDLDINITTATELIEQMRKQSEMFILLLTFTGCISLVIGGVGIMNIMLMSVNERRQEIGIRRALGAKQNDIRVQFLVESLLLTLIGGAIGLLLCLLTVYLVADYYAWDFFMSWTTITIGAGISIFIGLVSGFLPAHQAARLDPIQCLQAS
ncbi:MAG: FtsX-like permease family protein [Gammaproteobacteria bacterium]|nr:FtsX-like permease family protein [Gammaproteobacteria bacterium]